MIRVGSEIVIRRALPLVFDFVTDARNDCRWVAFAREASKLTMGPISEHLFEALRWYQDQDITNGGLRQSGCREPVR